MPGNLGEFKFADDLIRRCTVLLSFARHSTYMRSAIMPGETAMAPVSCSYTITFRVTWGNGWVCFVSARADR